jgi:hypothetical protein
MKYGWKSIKISIFFENMLIDSYFFEKLRTESWVLKIWLAVVTLSMPAMAASTFEIKTVIGDPGTVWGSLDSGTHDLILFVTGMGLLVAIIAAVLSFETHSITGDVGENMEQQGAKNKAFYGMLRTAGYFIAMLFFIGFVGLVFKLYG